MLPADIPSVIETNRTVAERRAGFDRHLVDGSKRYRDEWPSMYVTPPEVIEFISEPACGSGAFIPQAELESLAASHSPPQSWYDESTAGVFEPDDDDDPDSTPLLEATLGGEG